MNTNTLISPQPSVRSRLSPEGVEHYHREGYLVYNKPVFLETKFNALKGYFEGILADLPADQRPETMDVPHFMHPKLLDWAMDESVLSLVEPILGPDIALYSSHFICKPTGNGKRVPWHEDSAYWKGRIEPMEVCTVWLAIDPSTKVNGCMMVIPRQVRRNTRGLPGQRQGPRRQCLRGPDPHLSRGHGKAWHVCRLQEFTLKLLVSKSPWEIYDAPLDECVGRIVDAGYDAIEINLFDRPEPV